MRCLTLFLLTILILIAPVSKAFAKTVEISPAYVDITLKGVDDEESFDLNITNKTDQAIRIDVSSIDFKQTDPFGTIGFLGKEIGNYSYSLSSFLSFNKNTLEIAPNTKDKIIVTVKNREDLSPGGHYAAVIARQTPIDSREQTVISPALSSLIYLNKEGGERYNLSFKEVSFPKIPLVFSYPSTYSITLQNDGNVHLIPFGRADIKDMFGRVLYNGIINEGSLRILPQSRRYVPVYSQKADFSLPVSINKISIQGHDSLNKTSFIYEDIFIYINPLFAIGLISAIVILFYVRRKISKKDKRKK